MQFTKPNPFNGETFMKDLQENNVSITRFYDNGENQLVVEGLEKDKSKIESLLNNHDGSDSIVVDLRKSALAKLAALGLTEDEIAAL